MDEPAELRVPRLLTVREVAVILGRSRKTVYARIQAGVPT
jgi:predicted DNA-binding transcriptional regulator AlpA